MNPSFLVLAQAATNPLMQYLPLVGLLAIFYFILIRPQQKQAKEHRDMLSTLKKGDDVVTQAGILGKIHALTDKVVVLEIANGVRMRVLKTSVQAKASIADEPVVGKVEEKKEEK